MIIRPKSTIPVDVPETTLFDIMIFPLFQTREDAQTELGEAADIILGQPDPNRRRKNWFDPAFVGAEDDGEIVLYDVIHYHPQTGQPILGSDGRPKSTKLALSKWEAGRLNIGTGLANEFPPTTTFMRLQPYPFPIRQLHADEELAMSEQFTQTVVVRNKALSAQKPLPEGVFTSKDRELLVANNKLLRSIAQSLGIPLG